MFGSFKENTITPCTTYTPIAGPGSQCFFCKGYHEDEVLKAVKTLRSELGVEACAALNTLLRSQFLSRYEFDVLKETMLRTTENRFIGEGGVYDSLKQINNRLDKLENRLDTFLSLNDHDRSVCSDRFTALEKSVETLDEQFDDEVRTSPNSYGQPGILERLDDLEYEVNDLQHHQMLEYKVPSHKFSAPQLGFHGGLSQPIVPSDPYKCTRCGRYELDEVHAENPRKEIIGAVAGCGQKISPEASTDCVIPYTGLTEYADYFTTPEGSYVVKVKTTGITNPQFASNAVKAALREFQGHAEVKPPVVTITPELLRSWSKGGTLLGTERDNTCSFKLGELADRLNQFIASEIERQMGVK